MHSDNLHEVRKTKIMWQRRTTMFSSRLNILVLLGAFLIPSFSIAQGIKSDHSTVKSILFSYIKRGAADNSSIKHQKIALAVQWVFGKNLEKYKQVVDKYIEFKPDGSWKAIRTGLMLKEWKGAEYPGQTYQLWRFHKYGGKGYVRSEAIKEIKKWIELYKKDRDNKSFERADALQRYLDKNLENDEALKAVMSKNNLKEFDEHTFSQGQALKIVPGFVEY
jgi:hypothetical protein